MKISTIIGVVAMGAMGAVGAGIYGIKRITKQDVAAERRLDVEIQLAKERLARLSAEFQLAEARLVRIEAEAKLKLTLESFTVDDVAALSTDQRAEFDYLRSCYGVPLPLPDCDTLQVPSVDD